MMVRWILFGEIVFQISFSWFTKHVVVVLADSILYAIEQHIRSFGPFLMDVVIYYPVHNGVICLHGR